MSYSDEKKQYQYDDDDIAEVCVTGDDKRLPIHETRNKNHAFVECIGQLRTYYHHSIGGGIAIGTGTIFYVQGNKCLILTCGHNIRTKIYNCSNKYCKGKMLTNTKGCNKCGNGVVKGKNLYEAVRVTFIRRFITTAKFGEHDDEYECDMKQCIIDEQYSKCPHPKSGNDIAILVIDNKKAADYYRNKCKNIFLVNNQNLFDSDPRQMNLFGYPGDAGKIGKMWGMSTPNTNEFKCEFNSDTKKVYLINQQIDTAYGQSGSGIYCIGDNEDVFWVCSVHTGGSRKLKQNYGTLFTGNRLKWIQQHLKNIHVNIDNKIIQKSHNLSSQTQSLTMSNKIIWKKMPCGCNFEQKRIGKYIHDIISNTTKDCEIRCMNKCGKVWQVKWFEDIYINYLQQVCCQFCGEPCFSESNWCCNCKKPWRSDNNVDSIANQNKKLNITHKTTNNSSSKTNSNAMICGEMQDEKDQYSIEDLLKTEVLLCKLQNADNRKELFIKKLKLCCIIFDFTVADLDQNYQSAKEMKRTYLLELVEYISQSKHWFSEDCAPVILEMIGTNLFRSLPPVDEGFDPEENEPNDPSWPHLQCVYKFFHQFLKTADVKVIRKYIDKRFLLNIIDLFNSEDPRERDYLKLILHRIYGRCMAFRSFLRKAMNNVLYPLLQIFFSLSKKLV